MTGPEFSYDAARVEAIQPGEAVRLLTALRLDSEPIWLQTFADGPDDLYTAEQRTGSSGRPYTLKQFVVAGVPRSGRVSGRTEQTGSYTLKALGQGPFKLANLARVGVFFAVNVLKPDAQRRNADTVQRVAAVFLDLDGAPLPAEDFPILPTAIVESSPGRFHVYWAVHDLELSDFTTVQKHLAALYGGDRSVSDLPRVMRAPGYRHGKGAEGFLSRLVELNPDAQYTRADLLENFDGLAGALESAALAEAARLQKAVDQQTRAALLREELASGAATSQADAQRKYGKAAFLAELSELARAGQGGRNNQLFKSAAALGECVAAGLLEQSTVEAELTALALAVGLSEHETVDTLHRGLTRGMKKPRDLSNVGTRAGKRKEKPVSSLKGAAAFGEQLQAMLSEACTIHHTISPSGEKSGQAFFSPHQTPGNGVVVRASPVQTALTKYRSKLAKKLGGRL